MYRRLASWIVLWLVVLVCLPVEAQVRLFISDDQAGIKRYDVDSATLDLLVPDVFDPGQFSGLAIGPNGNLFAAASLLAPQVYEYSPQTGAQIGVGPFVFYDGTPPGPNPHDVSNPGGMMFSPTNGNLYIADVGNSNVHVYDGANGDSLGTLTENTLVQPTDVAFDSAGNLYVVSGSANVLRSDGGTQPLAEFVAVQSGGLTNPTALTFGPDEKLYVIDLSTFNILRYDSSGSFDTTFASFPLFQPIDLDFGPDGRLYVLGLDFSLATYQVLGFNLDGSGGGVVVDLGQIASPRYLLAVPEPASLALLGVGGLAMMVRRVRRTARLS